MKKECKNFYAKKFLSTIVKSLNMRLMVRTILNVEVFKLADLICIRQE